MGATVYVIEADHGVKVGITIQGIAERALDDVAAGRDTSQ